MRYFITDLDDISFELNKRKIATLFDDTANLVFFQIYFQELKEYGLFDEDEEKIFPNISQQDEKIFSLLKNNNSITFSNYYIISIIFDNI